MRQLVILFLFVLSLTLLSACSAGNGVGGEGDLGLDISDDTIVIDAPDLCVGPLCGEPGTVDLGDDDDDDVIDDDDDDEAGVRRCERMRGDVEELEGDVADLREQLFAADGLVAKRDVACAARSCSEILASGTIRSHEASKEEIAELAAKLGRCEQGDAMLPECVMGASKGDDCWDRHALAEIGARIVETVRETDARFEQVGMRFGRVMQDWDRIADDIYFEPFQKAVSSQEVSACHQPQRWDDAKEYAFVWIMGGRRLLKQEHPISAERTVIACEAQRSSLTALPTELPRFSGMSVTIAEVEAAPALSDDGSACAGLETRLADLTIEKAALEALETTVKDETNHRTDGCEQKADDQCNEALRAQDDILEAWKGFYGKPNDETTAIGECTAKRASLVMQADAIGKQYQRFDPKGAHAQDVVGWDEGCKALQESLAQWKIDNVLALGEEETAPSTVGGSNEGKKRFDASCPDGQLLIGFKFINGGDIDGIAPVCKSWTPRFEAKDGKGGLVGSNDTLAFVGQDDADDSRRSEQTRLCPLGYAVSRLFATKGYSSGGRNVGALGIECIAVDGHGRVRINDAQQEAPFTGETFSLFLKPVGTLADRGRDDDHRAKPADPIEERAECQGQFCAHWLSTRYRSSCEEGVASGIWGYVDEGDTMIHNLGLKCRPIQNEEKYPSWTVELAVEDDHAIEGWAMGNDGAAEMDATGDWDAWRDEGLPLMTGIAVERWWNGNAKPARDAVTSLMPLYRDIGDIFSARTGCNGQRCEGEFFLPGFNNVTYGYMTGPEDVQNLYDIEAGTRMACPRGHVATGVAADHYTISKTRTSHSYHGLSGLALRCTPIAFFRDADTIDLGTLPAYMTWTNMKGVTRDGSGHDVRTCDEGKALVGVVSNMFDATIHEINIACAPFTVKSARIEEEEE